MKKTFSQAVLDFNFSLPKELATPDGIEVLFPYENLETQRVMMEFYSKFYSDFNARVFIFGINPGRFGAGITGVPFTDPIRLETDCGIQNTFEKRAELSSQFVYAFIHAFGGIEAFCRHFFITAISPLGFLKDGVNYNYYDDKKLTATALPFITQSIEEQLLIGAERKVALCLGEGQNFKFFQYLNAQKGYFDQIIPLPHPRWVMQYRRKKMTEFVQKYVQALQACMAKI